MPLRALRWPVLPRCARHQACLAVAVIIAMSAWSLARAQSAERWELRVCAAPHDFPASSEDRPGYDNRIAALVADELGARATFVWTPLSSDTVRTHLETGRCDVMFGVADEATGLSSVAYLRAPYVFVQRSDVPEPVTSIDDERLPNLAIATYHDAVTRRAVEGRVPSDRLLTPDPLGTPGGPDFVTPALRGVLEGRYDVAMLYGPDAAAWVAEHAPEGLSVRPIAPEIVPPFLQMFRIVTAGVRSGDEALRDQLDLALARRWDEVRAVLDAYHVPSQEVPRPGLPGEPLPTLRVGTILPLATRNPSPFDVAAAAARTGAAMAEDRPEVDVAGVATRLDVRLAHAAGPETVVRAAERLVRLDRVAALIGGFTGEEARALAAAAERLGVPFLNVGVGEGRLRDRVRYPAAFHVAADDRAFLDALARSLAERGATRVLVVHEDTERGHAWREGAVAGLEAAGLEAAGGAPVAPGSFWFREPLAVVDAVAADGVLVAVAPQELEFFLSQAESALEGVPVALLPDVVTQTREFYFRLAQVAPLAGTGPRPALWDASLSGGEAGEFNERFAGRSGQPADPTGWATYASGALLLAAADRAESTDPTDLAVSLLDGVPGPELGKGSPLRFRPADQQLAQPLYEVVLDPNATWANAVSARIAVARVAAQLPGIPYSDGRTVPSAAPSRSLEGAP